VDAAFAAFLARQTPFHTETAVWGWQCGEIHLRLVSYLSDALPPLDLITSANALVLRDDAALVSRNRDDTHIWPGGRREVGETLLQTLSREVFEETGWTIRDATLLGFVHCQHETPKPEGYPYPYPDFVRAVYTADADRFTPDTVDPDDYEQESGFWPLNDVRGMTLRMGQHIYLEQALGLRQERGEVSPGSAASPRP